MPKVYSESQLAKRSVARQRAAGVFASAIGFFATALLVYAINRPPLKKAPESPHEGTAISIAPPRPPPTPPRKPRPQPTKTPKRDLPKAPALASNINGASFGLELDSEMLASTSQALLGEGDAKDLVMNAHSVDTLPKPIDFRLPPHPARARAKGIEGFVSVSVLIEADGHVSQTRLVQAQPPGVFEDSVLRTAKTWRFEPATYHGERVRMWATQTVRFTLN